MGEAEKQGREGKATMDVTGIVKIWANEYNGKTSYSYSVKVKDQDGAVKYAKLGNALVYICDTRDMTDTVKRLWEKTDHDLCIRKEEIPREYYT